MDTNNVFLISFFFLKSPKHEFSKDGSITSTSVSDPDPVGSGSVSGSVDMDPGSAKINQNHGINKSKWFVNVLFT